MLASCSTIGCAVQLRGHFAHLAWCKASFSGVLRYVEEAHALLEQRGGVASTFLLVSQRLYLAEQVAFALASRGYEIADEESTTEGAPPIERREIIRLLDLALSMLGADARAAALELDDASVVSLRNKILRLRAHLCMLDDEARQCDSNPCLLLLL